MNKNIAFYQSNPYLDNWKKELDDESINKHVLNTLLSSRKSIDNILDVGTGSGAQIRRNIELGLLNNNGTIIGIDINASDLKNSILSFKEWAKLNKYDLKIIEDPEAIHHFTISNNNQKYTIKLYQGSVFDLGTKKSCIQNSFPLITALSLLEHTDMEKSLKSIRKVMIKGGLLYMPINYDQHTIFGPTPISTYQAESNLMQLFNYSGIDFQFKGDVGAGNSQCGSLLPTYCANAGLKILDYGSSDWVITSEDFKPYTPNKKKVLAFFIDAFYNVMKGSSNRIKQKFHVSDAHIENWYNLRRDQLSSGKLYYSCIQKDILCQK